MNWNIDKTTANERVLIQNTMYCLFDDLERATTLLDTVMEDFFEEREQKPISESSAKWIRDLLHTVREIIWDTTLSYNLLVANTEDPRVERYLDVADRVRAAIQCDHLCDKVDSIERNLPTDRRTIARNARFDIMDMEDTAAISELNAIVNCKSEYTHV